MRRRRPSSSSSYRGKTTDVLLLLVVLAAAAAAASLLLPSLLVPPLLHRNNDDDDGLPRPPPVVAVAVAAAFGVGIAPHRRHSSTAAPMTRRRRGIFTVPHSSILRFAAAGAGSSKTPRTKPTTTTTTPTIEQQQDHRDQQQQQQHNNDDKEALLKICTAHFAAQALHAFCRLGLHRILLPPQPVADDGDDDNSDSFLSLDAITQKLQPERQQRADDDGGDDDGEEHHQTHPTAAAAAALAARDDAARLLRRTLRLLVADGVLRENSRGEFALTSAGAWLSRGGGDSMVLHWMEAPLWNAWAALPDHLLQLVVLSNHNNNSTAEESQSSSSSPFEIANGGVSSGVYYGQDNHPESLRRANDLVRYIANEEVGACADGIDWAELCWLHRNSSSNNHNHTTTTATKTTIVDVGGGHRGDVMRAVAARCPDARCMVLDLPSVVQQAFAAPVVEGGVEFVAGDLFDPASFPSDCDILFTKHVVFCELDDADSRRALRSCAAVLPAHGRLIVAEAALPDPGGCGAALDDPLSLRMDAFLMLVGRESAKTRGQWKEAAAEAGLRLISIQKTHLPTCSILHFVKQ